MYNEQALWKQAQKLAANSVVQTAGKVRTPSKNYGLN